jgi:hypothetical protein
MSEGIAQAKVGPDVYFIYTSLGQIQCPPCVHGFAKVINSHYRYKPRSRIYKKWERYRLYMERFAQKQYMAGAIMGEVVAPTWGEFDLHDMLTHKRD